MDKGMDILLCAVIVGLLVLLFKQKNQKQKPSVTDEKESDVHRETPQKELKVKGAYKQRWLFTYHEKDAYQKLKPIAEDLGYTVFAKVRLLDLLEPVSGNPQYRTYFNKIKAKHVDFVLCDKKLVARVIIELDDSSHDAIERKERDAFVDEVLQSVGYKIIHTRAITNDIKEKLQS